MQPAAFLGECPFCGAPLTVRGVFCPHCGNRLAQSQSHSHSQSQTHAPTPTLPFTPMDEYSSAAFHTPFGNLNQVPDMLRSPANTHSLNHSLNHNHSFNHNHSHSSGPRVKTHLVEQQSSRPPTKQVAWDPRLVTSHADPPQFQTQPLSQSQSQPQPQPQLQSQYHHYPHPYPPFNRSPPAMPPGNNNGNSHHLLPDSPTPFARQTEINTAANSMPAQFSSAHVRSHPRSHVYAALSQQPRLSLSESASASASASASPSMASPSGSRAAAFTTAQHYSNSPYGQQQSLRPLSDEHHMHQEPHQKTCSEMAFVALKGFLVIFIAALTCRPCIEGEWPQ